MRTDTIFYQLFLKFHGLLFELLGQPVENADRYQFTSVEVKEKAFRFDGIFMPTTSDRPIYFVEVQFQDKPDFYWEFITEINIYLNQYKPVQDWQAVAIFANRNIEVKVLTTYQQELVDNSRIVRIYLDELRSQDSIAIGLIQLITSKDEEAPQLVKRLLAKARIDLTDLAFQESIIELLESVLLSKFPKLSRKEIETMFALSDLRQTRVYQEAMEEGEVKGEAKGEARGRQEGRQNEAKTLLVRMLSKRFGKLTDRQEIQISELSIEELENLGEALLDFATVTDLDNWLQNL
jgi:predicted transposase/invertase (TIGR01784 family)